MAKPNPYRHAAHNMSKMVSDDAILESIDGKRHGNSPDGKPKATPPDPQEPDGTNESFGATHGDGEMKASPHGGGHPKPEHTPGGTDFDKDGVDMDGGGSSHVDRMEQSFTSRNKRRSVDVGAKGRGEVGSMHHRGYPKK